MDCTRGLFLEFSPRSAFLLGEITEGFSIPRRKSHYVNVSQKENFEYKKYKED